MIGLKQEFSKEFKLAVIKEVLEGKITKEQARRKYNLRGKCAVLNWMRRFGITELKQLSQDQIHKVIMAKASDPQQLQKKIKELEKALEEAQLKATAYSTMIDVAERELKINIRKKSDTKQSKK